MKKNYSKYPKKTHQKPDCKSRQIKERSRYTTDGKPLIYGLHAVREAWLNPERTINSLYILESVLKGFEDILNLANEKQIKRPQYKLIEKRDLEKLLPQGAVHQGIAIDADNLDEVDLQDFSILSQSKEHSILLMLDQVTDPHNVGAIIRSASAFGADGIIMQKKHAPALTGVLAKTACGAVDHLRVAQATNLSRALEQLKEDGYFVIGLDERGEKTIRDISSASSNSQKVVLVLGAEGAGLRHLVRENCDELVSLPTQGAIQSINVSNAAAVALYALA